LSINPNSTIAKSIAKVAAFNWAKRCDNLHSKVHTHTSASDAVNYGSRLKSIDFCITAHHR